MRYLVKGDCSIPCTNLSDVQLGTRRHARRSRVRRVIALLCLALAGFFVIQLVGNVGGSSPISPEWDSPSSVLAWLRWSFGHIGYQIRNEIKGTVPFGNLGVILKLACCAVAAAVFLRGPSQA